LPVFGVVQLLEGVIFLVAPFAGLRLMSIMTEERLGLIRLLGVIALVLAAIIFAVLLPTAA
jgi:hypothetical protein